MTYAAKSDLQSVRSFLIALRALGGGDARLNLNRLSNFFSEVARLRRLTGEAAPIETTEQPPGPMRLAEFAAKYRPLYEAAWRDGAFVDVWSVASVQSNEIRNAAVLAWLLDARQTHGRGNTILGAWLRRLYPLKQAPFLSPAAWSGVYSVVTESYPLGDVKNRVDVVLESSRALMFIEVKVNARETERQVQRYLALANAKANARSETVEAGVVYLTPSWAAAPVIDAPTQVVHATWTSIADAIEEVITPANNGGFVDRLLVQFANHVGGF